MQRKSEGVWQKGSEGVCVGLEVAVINISVRSEVAVGRIFGSALVDIKLGRGECCYFCC